MVRSLAAPAALAAAAILLAGGLAEAGLRLTHYGEAGSLHLSKFEEYDPVLGWYHKRNYTVQLTTPDYQTTLHYDDRGIRGFDPPYEKPPGISRILVVGDSFVDGFTVDLHDRLSEVLAAAAGPRYEVINFGVSAYSTDQELLLLRQEGWKYHPDLVILAFYYNDVLFNAQTLFRGAAQKPVFRLDSGGNLRLTNVPVPYPRPELEDRFKLYGLARSALKGSGWLYALAQKAGVTQGAPAENSWPAPAGAAGDALVFSVYRKIATPETTAAWVITQALIREMKQESEQHGAALAALYVPTRVELSTAEWSDSKIPPDYDPHQVVREFLGICKAEKIDCIEPSSRFRERASQTPLYDFHEPHWNAAGHRLAGSVLAEYVLNSRRH